MVVVIFRSRLREPAPGYAKAAAHMEELAALQPGYCGMTSVRDAAGWGITLSYWADDHSARAWHANPDHQAAIRAGKQRWYSEYQVEVARLERRYGSHEARTEDSSDRVG